MVLSGIDHNWVFLILWFHCHLYMAFMVFSCLLVWAASDIASFFDFSENHYSWEVIGLQERLYRIFHRFFFVLLILVCEFFVLFFHVPLFEWLLTFIGTVILWRPLRLREVIGLREGIYLPFLLEKKTLFYALFLLFHTALELVCFLHFESLITDLAGIQPATYSPALHQLS